MQPHIIWTTHRVNPEAKSTTMGTVMATAITTAWAMTKIKVAKVVDFSPINQSTFQKQKCSDFFNETAWSNA